ncbi:Protein TPX2, partial [Cucurbita argyrosperma subsp. argyrosperma]
MGSIGKNGGTMTPVKDSTGSGLKMIQEVSGNSENTNPNVNDSISSVPKLWKSSPSMKSAKTAQKSAAKNPSAVLNSPKYKIRERKFVVAKKNSKNEKSGKCKTDCKCEVNTRSDAKKCLCLAYETLRASQEEFFKNQSGGIGEIDETEQLDGSIRAEIDLEEEMERKLMIQDLQNEDRAEAEAFDVNGESESPEQVSSSVIKRRRERLLETARNSVPETGSGKVKHLVMAFEKLRTIRVSKDSDELSENQEKAMEEKNKVIKWALPGLPPPKVSEMQGSSSSLCPSELFFTSENRALDPAASVSSSWDSSRGSISSRTSHGGRRSRRNSTESDGTLGGSRWKKRQLKVTRQKPFKLRTEQRGKEKGEEFLKRVQETMMEQERQRIPIAQGLPWTTDEPEQGRWPLGGWILRSHVGWRCLVKPPVKENTRPVDLVLHSDVRAVERAEFDNQVAEKLSLIEQYKMDREKQQKMAEEEELRRLRKELVPKAQPMPYFDRPFIPRRSAKLPTIPREPKFHIPQQKKSKSCLPWNDVGSHHHYTFQP